MPEAQEHTCSVSEGRGLEAHLQGDDSGLQSEGFFYTEGW